MATNGPKGKGREGMVADRSQVLNPHTGRFTKRDGKSGQFIDVKSIGGLFKGIRREKKK